MTKWLVNVKVYKQVLWIWRKQPYCVGDWFNLEVQKNASVMFLYVPPKMAYDLGKHKIWETLFLLWAFNRNYTGCEWIVENQNAAT
jgi:hypothetical protein